MWIEHPTWILTRAAGLASYVFLWASVVSGMLQSARTGFLPPPRLLQVHRWASAWAAYTLTVHIVILLYDAWQPFTVAELLLPFASRYRPEAVALGVYALYGLCGVQVTSLLLGLIPPKIWRWTHWLAYPTLALVLGHALLAGTDVQAVWTRWLYGLTAACAIVAVLLRVFRRLPGAVSPIAPIVMNAEGEK